MRRYSIIPQARADLKRIYEYIARDNERAAGRLQSLFLKKFELLAQQPFMGEVRNDLVQGMRMFTADRYVILYQPTKQGVRILQIVHSAQDITTVVRKPG
jgi:toxin ParE1/3/4